MNTYRFYEQGGTHVLGTFSGNTLLGERTFNIKRLEAIEYQGKIDIKDKVTEKYILKEQVYTNILKEDGTVWGNNVANSVIELNIFLNSIPYNIADLQDIPYPKVDNGYLKFQDGDYDWETLAVPSPPPESTDFLSEGVTNLYFTNTRVDERIALTNLEDLNNVEFADVQGSQIISFNSTTSKWENTNLPISSPWTVNASSITYTNGNVGIGTTTPQESLSVVGRIALNDGNSNVAIGNDANTQTTGSFNTAIGVGALRGVGGATFNRNVGVGYGAGNGLTTGSDNVLVGKEAGTAITTSLNNTAVGSNALGSLVANTTLATRGDNIAIGANALNALSSGSGNYGQLNVVIGTNAATRSGQGQIANTAQMNVIIGANAYQLGDGGYGNTIVGHEGGNALVNEQGQTLIGHRVALNASTNQPYNNSSVVIGSLAGENSNLDRNVFIGGNGAGSNGTGNLNVFIGSNSRGESAIVGSVAIGANTRVFASGAIAIGNGSKGNGNSVAIGQLAMYQSTSTATDSVAIGQNVLVQSQTPANYAIGKDSLQQLVSGNDNISIGRNVGDTLTSASYNTMLGSNTRTLATAGDGNTHLGYAAGALLEGSNNTIVGREAGNGVNGSSDVSNITAVGYRAAYLVQTANVTAVGYQALSSLTTGADNTAVGFQAGTALSTGVKNTLLGHRAGAGISTGTDNVCIGVDVGGTLNGVRNVYIAGRSLTGSTTDTIRIGVDASGGNNSIAIGVQSNARIAGVAIGRSAGLNNSGDFIVAVGSGTQAAGGATAVGHDSRAGVNSVSIGLRAGEGTTGAANNTIIGYWAGLHSTGSRNVFIGFQAGRYETNSDRLYIENSNSTSPLIYGEFDNDLVRINGSFEATGGYGFGGQTASAIQTGYTPTNVTTTRSFNADSVTLDDLADVVGTLIEDLKTKGLILA